SRFKF
ncbi:ammonium Transporter family protein, partial [Vibrio parahaemolyticus V-223/04]